MARYRNTRTGDVAVDDGELGLAHIDAWELATPPEADEADEDAAAPAEASSAPRSTPRKRATPSK